MIAWLFGQPQFFNWELAISLTNLVTGTLLSHLMFILQSKVKELFIKWCIIHDAKKVLYFILNAIHNFFLCMVYASCTRYGFSHLIYVCVATFSCITELAYVCVALLVCHRLVSWKSMIPYGFDWSYEVMSEQRFPKCCCKFKSLSLKSACLYWISGSARRY